MLLVLLFGIVLFDSLVFCLIVKFCLLGFGCFNFAGFGIFVCCLLTDFSVCLVGCMLTCLLLFRARFIVLGCRICLLMYCWYFEFDLFDLFVILVVRFVGVFGFVVRFLTFIV